MYLVYIKSLPASLSDCETVLTPHDLSIYDFAMQSGGTSNQPNPYIAVLNTPGRVNESMRMSHD